MTAVKMLLQPHQEWISTMNEHMRRSLSQDWEDEDWDVEDEPEEPRRERERRPAKPLAEARRQAQKEWGKAHTKAWRSSEKYQRNRKP